MTTALVTCAGDGVEFGGYNPAPEALIAEGALETGTFPPEVTGFGVMIEMGFDGFGFTTGEGFGDATGA